MLFGCRYWMLDVGALCFIVLWEEINNWGKDYGQGRGSVLTLQGGNKKLRELINQILIVETKIITNS